MSGDRNKPNSSLKRGGLIPGVRYPMVQSENDRVWMKYCGFLDINIEQFMSIQESLLMQQLSQITNCSLGRRLLGKRTPVSLEEFRRIVPLTTYKDYLPELDPGDVKTLRRNHYRRLDELILRFLLVLAGVLLASFGQTYLMTYIAQMVMKDIRTELYDHTIRLSLGYLNPDDVDIHQWANRESEGTLLVPKAGELLYRVR